MAEYYRRAHEKAGKTDPYPFANWAAAEILANRLDATRVGELLPKLDEQCQAMAALARERNVAEPNFWAAVGEADCELARLLPRAAVDQADIERVADIYRLARVRGASPRELASVREHIDFLIDVLSTPGSELRTALQAIRATL